MGIIPPAISLNTAKLNTIVAPSGLVSFSNIIPAGNQTGLQIPDTAHYSDNVHKQLTHFQIWFSQHHLYKKFI